MSIDNKLNTQVYKNKKGNSRITVLKNKENIKKTDVVTTLPINTDPTTIDNGLITPPFDNINLYQLRDGSSPLAACLLAISKAVADYGYRIEKKTEPQRDMKLSEVIQNNIEQLNKLINTSNIEQNTGDINTLLQEKLKELQNLYITTKQKEIQNEKEESELQKVRYIFENVHPEKSINQIIKEITMNGLLYGYSGIEVILNATETGFKLENIPTHEFYFTERESSYTSYTYIDTEGNKVSSKWKFRRYAQKQATNSDTVYFKELYDPRHLNFKDGNFYPSLPDSDEANICLPFKFGMTADGEYPHPIWLGETNNILGYKYATELNKDWFEEGMMVPMIILFNGMLDSETYEALKSMLAAGKGIEGRTKAMIIENMNAGTDVGKDFDMEAIKTKFEMDIKRLPAMDMDDGQFLNYIDKTKENVRMIFNLPAILLGQEETYNRATATIAYEMAETQVFIPIRKTIERGINNLLRRIGIYDYIFKLNSPTITDYTKWQAMLKPFLDLDIIPINEAYALYNEIFNRDLEAKENRDLLISEYKKRYLESLKIEENKVNIDDFLNNTNEEFKQENNTDQITPNIDEMYDDSEEV